MEFFVIFYLKIFFIYNYVIKKFLFQVNKTFSPLVDAVEMCSQWLDTWSVQVSEALTNSSEHLEIIDVSC